MSLGREPWIDSGALRIARVGEATVRVHGSTAVVLLWLGSSHGGLAVWLAGFFVLLVHELGHAVIAWRMGAAVTAITVMPLGGRCELRGALTKTQLAAIAWGGVLAQSLVYCATVIAVKVFGVPTTGWVRELVWTLTVANQGLMLLSLLPARGLDGAEAWSLLSRWLQGVVQTQQNAVVRRRLAEYRREGVSSTVRVTLQPDDARSVGDDGDGERSGEHGREESTEARELASRLWNDARRG